MRSSAFLSIVLCAPLALPAAALAQNYVQSSRYGSPDVIVNLDVLGANAPVNPMMQRMQPLLPPQQEVKMMPPQQPVRMQPPVANLQPPPNYQPPMMPTPMAPQPVMNNELAAPMSKAPPVAEPDFNASDLAAMTPPAASMPEEKPVEEKAEEVADVPPSSPVPVMAAPKEMPKPPVSPVMLAAQAPSPVMKKAVAPPLPVPPPLPPVVKAPEVKPEIAKGRTLLAQAREEANDSKPAMRNTVLFDENAPPAPVTGKEELAAKTADSKPIAPPVVMASVMSPPTVEELAPPVMAKPMTKEETKIASIAPQQLVPVMAKPIAAVAEEKLSSNSKAVGQENPSSSNGVTGQEKDAFEAYRILFDADKTELKPDERAQLDKVVAKLKRNEDVQVQLLAYANGTPDTASKARRTSLTRAMEVRNYLLQAGILANRLDVRALGMGSSAMQDSARSRNIPPDRVDMIFGKKDAS